MHLANVYMRWKNEQSKLFAETSVETKQMKKKENDYTVVFASVQSPVYCPSTTFSSTFYFHLLLLF